MTNKTVKLDTVNFKDILMTNIIYNMTENPTTEFSFLNSETQRHLAVIAALELIRADVYSSSTAPLHTHLENISIYADKIMNAMKVNNR